MSETIPKTTSEEETVEEPAASTSPKPEATPTTLNNDNSGGGSSDVKIDAEADTDLLAVETIPEAALESVKRELMREIADLEWEFKQIKEALFAERIAQVDRKLQQLRASEAPELLKVSELVDETYRMRKQVSSFQQQLLH